MSVQDCFDFIAKLDTMQKMPTIRTSGTNIVLADCKVSLWAELTRGPPIEINVKNDVYQGFWKDLARKGVGEVMEFEDVEYKFRPYNPPPLKHGEFLVLPPPGPKK